MATQLAETRSERVVILMTPTEKREVARRAGEAGLSISEFLRLSAELGAMTPAEQAEFVALTQELEAMNARLSATFAALEETSRRTIDEDALREKYRAELEARTDIDWTALANFLTGSPRA